MQKSGGATAPVPQKGIAKSPSNNAANNKICYIKSSDSSAQYKTLIRFLITLLLQGIIKALSVFQTQTTRFYVIITTL